MPTPAQLCFVAAHPVARLATADKNGAPHVIPICYVVDGSNLYVTIDEKPKRTINRPVKRVRNILENPQVAVIVDRYDEDWSKLGWVMLRGRGEILDDGDEHQAAQAQLRERYPQYRNMELEGLSVIAVRIEHVTSWGNLD